MEYLEKSVKGGNLNQAHSESASLDDDLADGLEMNLEKIRTLQPPEEMTVLVKRGQMGLRKNLFFISLG